MICKHCSREFTHSKFAPVSLYCANSCKQAAFRVRKKSSLMISSVVPLKSRKLCKKRDFTKRVENEAGSVFYVSVFDSVPFFTPPPVITFEDLKGILSGF